MTQEIAIIIGTRAELIKTFPIMLELKKINRDYFFIHTGQHSLGDLCKIFEVKTPDIILSSEPNKSSKFNTKESKAIIWAIKIIFKIRKELRKLKEIKYVIFHGDTLSTCVSSIGSSRLLNPFKKYKNVHLEGGLRSASMKSPFPEEIIRRIVTYFSDILFIPSEEARLNVENKDHYYVIGNTILDSVHHALKIGETKNLKPLDEKFALVTIHRHENIKNKEKLEKIIEILNSVNIPIYFSLHDNTKAKLEEFGLYETIRNNKNITILEGMDYISFIYQMSKCSLIICDGGSMQEESLIFHKPCIILRMNTERPEGLKSNFQFLSKLNVEKTKEKIREYLSKDYKVQEFKNPYGEVGVSKKIVEKLM